MVFNSCWPIKRKIKSLSKYDCVIKDSNGDIKKITKAVKKLIIKLIFTLILELKI